MILLHCRPNTTSVAYVFLALFLPYPFSAFAQVYFARNPIIFELKFLLSFQQLLHIIVWK